MSSSIPHPELSQHSFSLLWPFSKWSCVIGCWTFLQLDFNVLEEEVEKGIGGQIYVDERSLTLRGDTQCNIQMMTYRTVHLNSV